MKARYRAELEVIRSQYAEYELIGPPEVREGEPGSFNPTRRDDEPQA